MASDKDIIPQLKQHIGQLSDWLHKNDPDLTKPNNKQVLLNALVKLEQLSDEVIPELAEELDVPHDEIGFADFLSDIGNSVLETQRQLDEQSRVYLEEIRPSKHITPAIYRIPKVSASIKFGMRKSKSKGFNIVVAQRRREEERTLNQSLEFEIISVPPPPDFQQTLAGEVPGIGFVFSPPVRHAIFASIEQYQTNPNHEQPGLNKDLLLAHKNEVLILQIGPRLTPHYDDYLLLFANEEDDKNVGIWSLQRDPNGKKDPVFEIILKFSASGRQGENYKLLRDIIIAHSEQQVKLLT